MQPAQTSKETAMDKLWILQVLLSSTFKAPFPQNPGLNNKSIFTYTYSSLFSSQFAKSGEVIYKHERQCFIGISKHREESWKYVAQRSIFDEIRGVG